MSTSKKGLKVILVTGANRGIGFAIVKSLAQHAQLPSSSSAILLGCRDFNAGVRACNELGNSGIHNVEPLQIDVTSDASIRDAIGKVEDTYGQLDVLINSAGYAAIPAEDMSDLRQTYQIIYNVNVTSVAITSYLCLPLLRRSPHGGKVIQVGSARGSLHLNATDALPPTASAAYSVSKAALNMLTVDMARAPENKDVEFQIANPGHCKTAFNGYKGTRSPEEGAIAVVELVLGERRETKMWQTIGASRELIVMPW